LRTTTLPSPCKSSRKKKKKGRKKAAGRRYRAGKPSTTSILNLSLPNRIGEKKRKEGEREGKEGKGKREVERAATSRRVCPRRRSVKKGSRE